MNTQTNRRARILRIRAVEHSIATTRLARADATLANLVQIATRLTLLRRSLTTQRGDTLGRSLNAQAEMAGRLESAAVSLALPIKDAEQARGRVDADRQSARRKEKGAAKLHEHAVRMDEAARDQRVGATTIWRKPASHWGVSK